MSEWAVGRRWRHAILRMAMAVMCLLALSPAGEAQQRGGREGALVAIDEVRQMPLSQTVPVIGRLVARQSGVVAARTRGPVAEIRVNVGDRVENGDIVAVLVLDRLEAERRLRAAEAAEAQAAMQTAKEEFTFVQQELRRLENLRRSAAFSQARYEDKVQDVAKARSSIAEAEAVLLREQVNLTMAEIDLRDAEIRAPFGGVVSMRHTEVGSYLNVGDDVVTLINDLNLEIEADVPASRISGLAPGTEIAFRLSDGSDLKAKVRAVVPEENPLTRTRTVRFTPEFNGNRNLATNQSVTLYLPVGEPRDVTTVHKDAVISRGGRKIVFVAKDGAADMRSIRLGEAVGSRFEVVDGLEQGDLVVVRGNERLRQGQKIVLREGG